jgi:hypothetical protein
MVDKAGQSTGSLFLVARIVFSTIIIFVAVLAVDVVELWLHNLDMGTWLTLLWWEGVVMAFLGGGAGWWWRENPEPVFTPTGKLLTKVKLKFRYPWFWVSLGVAGLMLIVLAGYLGLQYY